MLAYLKFKFAKKDTNLQERQQVHLEQKWIPKPISKHQVVVHVDSIISQESLNLSTGKNSTSRTRAKSQIPKGVSATNNVANQVVENENPFDQAQTYAAGKEQQIDESMRPIARPRKSSVKGIENQLEDRALVQSMFENGTLICQGEAEQFVDIIRTSRKSIQNIGSVEVSQLLDIHPGLFDVSSEEAGNENNLANSLLIPEQQPPVKPVTPRTSTFMKKLFGNLKGEESKEQASQQQVEDYPTNRPTLISTFKLGHIGQMFQMRPSVEAGDAGATPICNNVRARLISDDFIEVTNEDDDDKEPEQPATVLKKEEEEKKSPEKQSPISKLAAEQAVVQDFQKLGAEILTSIVIEDNYIMTSHLGDWENLYSEYEFSADQQSWNLKSEHPVVFKQIKEAIQKFQLSNGQNRKLAWSLLIGISASNVNNYYKNLYEGYLSDAFNLAKSTVNDLKVQRQISLDVQRTFAQSRISAFIAPIDEQKNSLYNVLAAYAKHCPEVGYCQGMNFLCGLILIGVDYNEISAFVILERLLGEYGQLGTIYDCKLTKLFSLSDHVYTWLLTEEPELEELISSHGVPLTTLFAGPLLAVFANIFEDPETCLNIVDRLILQKEDGLVSIIKHVFRTMRAELLKFSPKNQTDLTNSALFDSSVLQAYLVRTIYIETHRRGLLFPPIQNL